MKKILPLILIVIVGIVAALFLTQADFSSESQRDENKIQVVTSILPLADLVEKVGGEMVEAQALVPPGASVHTYEPTPAQLRDIANADIFVKVGTDLEFEVLWLDKLLEINSQLQVVDASKGIELIEFESHHSEEHGDEDHSDDEHGHEDHDEEEHADDHNVEEKDHGHSHEGGLDPHIWLSPANLQIMATTIAQALGEYDTNQADFFLAQNDLVQEELTAIDTSIKASLASVTDRQIIVYHDAWGYFANDYNLELIPVEEDGKEPTARRIEEIIRIGRENNVKYIFASPEFNTQSSETIANELGAEVVLISPLPERLFESLQEVARLFEEA